MVDIRLLTWCTDVVRPLCLSVYLSLLPASTLCTCAYECLHIISSTVRIITIDYASLSVCLFLCLLAVTRRLARLLGIHMHTAALFLTGSGNKRTMIQNKDWRVQEQFLFYNCHPPSPPSGKWEIYSVQSGRGIAFTIKKKTYRTKLMFKPSMVNSFDSGRTMMIPWRIKTSRQCDSSYVSITFWCSKRSWNEMAK